MVKITFKVTRATVLLTEGPDLVSLFFEGEKSYPIMGYDPFLKIETQANYGVEWLRKTCPEITPEVINMRVKHTTTPTKNKY